MSLLEDKIIKVISYKYGVQGKRDPDVRFESDSTEHNNAATEDYLEGVRQISENMKNYAESLGFNDFSDKMVRGRDWTSWERNGYVISLPDRPEEIDDLVIEKLKR